MTPDDAATELLGIVADAIARQPRSLQQAIGPSELGTPCDRRLGYKLSGTPQVNPGDVPWKPWIGTGMHEMLAGAFARDEISRLNRGEPGRWHVEARVTVGSIGGKPVTGSADLYDEKLGIVWDWKTSSRSMIARHYKAHGPGETYKRQANLYGRGFALAGFPVNHVGIVFLPRDGEFRERHVWHEPYDEKLATETLARADAIHNALAALGPSFTLPTLPVAEAFCSHCPWHDPKSRKLDRACPGAKPPETATRTLAQALA